MNMHYVCCVYHTRLLSTHEYALYLLCLSHEAVVHPYVCLSECPVLFHNVSAVA